MLGEKLLIKLWETLARDGVGSLAKPWQIKRTGRAHAEVRREEMLLLAQAEVEASQIRKGAKRLLPDGSLVDTEQKSDSDDFDVDYLGRLEPTINFDAFSQKIDQQKRANEIQQEININRAIAYAEEELGRSEQEPSDEEVDSDWLFRWRENAKNTSNDELRRLWARTLAGEIKAPGSYSLRTLEFIKNLSQDEALSIAKLGQFAIEQSIFKADELDKEDVDLQFLLQMDELGILSGVQAGEVGGLEMTFNTREPHRFVNFLVNRNLILIVESDDPKKKFKLGCYKLSKTGRELLSLGDFKANANYMRELGRMIKAQGFEVKIADWVQTHADSGRYFNAEAL